MNINLFFRLLLGLIFIGAIQVSAAQENSLSKEDKKKLVTDLIEVFYTKISNKKIQSQFDATKNIYNIIQKSSKEDLARNSPIIEILFNVINHKALNYNPNGAIKIASKAYGGPSFFWRSYDFKDLIKTPEYAIFLNKLINDDSLYNALYQELEKAKAVADRNEAAKKVKDANPNPTDTYSEIVRQNDLPDAQAEKESAQKSVKEIEEKLNQEPGSIGSETLKADLEEKQLLLQAAQKKEEVAKKEKEEREEKKIAAQRAQEEAEAVLKQKREDLKKQEEAARLAAEEQKKKEVEAERKRVAEAQVKAEEERRVVLQKAVQAKKSQVEQARNEVDRLGKEIEKLKKEEQSQWFGRWMQSGEAKRKKIEDMRLERGKALTILSKALQEETALQKGELVEQNQLELFVSELTQREKKDYKWDMVKESGLSQYEKNVYEQVLNYLDKVYGDIVVTAGTRETGNGEGLSFLIWEATQQKDSEAIETLLAIFFAGMGKLQLDIFKYIPHSPIETGRSIRIGTIAEAKIEIERLAAQARARLAEMAQKKAESAANEGINAKITKDPTDLKETATLYVLSKSLNAAKSAAGAGAKAAVDAAANETLINLADSAEYKAYNTYMEERVKTFDNKPYKTIQQVFYPRVSEMSPEEVELGKKYNMHRLISFKDLKDFSVAFTRLLIVNRLIEKLYATQFFAKNPAWQASLRWLVEKPSDTNRTDKFLCLLRSLAKSSDITEELLTACDIKISFLSSDQIFPKKVYDQQDYQAKVFEILFKSLNKEDLGFLDFSNQGVMPEKTIREHLQEKRAALLKYSRESNKEVKKVLPYFQKIDSDRANQPRIKESQKVD